MYEKFSLEKKSSTNSSTFKNSWFRIVTWTAYFCRHTNHVTILDNSSATMYVSNEIHSSYENSRMNIFQYLTVHFYHNSRLWKGLYIRIQTFCISNIFLKPVSCKLINVLRMLSSQDPKNNQRSNNLDTNFKTCQESRRLLKTNMCHNLSKALKWMWNVCS